MTEITKLIRQICIGLIFITLLLKYHCKLSWSGCGRR